MNSIDIRREVHRVIGGKAGFPPLAFPHDEWAVDTVVNWTRTFVETSGALNDTQRALFIRKLAVYVVRRGKTRFRDLDFTYGTAWFVRQPELLASKLTFGGAMRREGQRLAFVFRRANKPERDTTVADTRAPLVPKPVVLVDGAFCLEKFVHPLHIVEAGLRADNCLVRAVGGRNLPNPLYWLSVKRGDRHLFGLTHHGDLCLLISIIAFSVTEMQFIHRPKGVQFVMPLVVDALQRIFGTLWPAHHNLPWPFPPEPSRLVVHDPDQFNFHFAEQGAAHAGA